MASRLEKKTLDRAQIRMRLLNTKRLGFYPIENPRLIEVFDRLKLSFWTVEELNFSEDRAAWKKLDPKVQRFISAILGMFSQLDGIIMENLMEKFKYQAGLLAKECNFFFVMQISNELTHAETYHKTIETLLEDQAERDALLDSIANYDDIYDVAEWAFTQMDSDAPLVERVIAFASIEGVLFSSLFAAIYWFKRHHPHQLLGLTKGNEFIARDEGEHTYFACELFAHITKKWRSRVTPEVRAVIGDPSRPSVARAHEIIRSAVDVNEKFTRRLMSEKLPGLSLEDMMSYVYATADSLAVSLGYPVIYGVKNRLEWMKTIVLPNTTNFFEEEVTEYSRTADGNLDTSIPEDGGDF